MLNIFAKKKTSAEWLVQETYVKQILDPDGWDRKNFEESWNKKITRKEFQKRLAKSTCMFVNALI